MNAKIAMLVSLAAILSIAGWVWKSSAPEETLYATRDGTVEKATSGVPRASNTGQNFDTIDPDLWAYKKQAEEILNKPGNGPGTEAIVYGVVQRPPQDGKESTLYYFATHSAVYLPPPADTGDLFNAIYAYDSADQTWERLFKRESSYNFNAPQPGDLQTFHVLGFDRERLIVQIMADEVLTKDPHDLWSVPFKETEGPNGSYTASSGLVTIDLASPYSKRPPYKRP